jgi:aspartate 1-decarboxylase
MLRFLVKSKIQRVRVTDKNLASEGGIAIDDELLQKADILEGELVQVVNITTGARFETYATKTIRSSGSVILNGDLAWLGNVGDELIIISYTGLETVAARSLEPKKVIVDKDNHIINDRNNSRSG